MIPFLTPNSAGAVAGADVPQGADALAGEDGAFSAVLLDMQAEAPKSVPLVAVLSAAIEATPDEAMLETMAEVAALIEDAGSPKSLAFAITPEESRLRPSAILDVLQSRPDGTRKEGIARALNLEQAPSTVIPPSVSQRMVERLLNASPDASPHASRPVVPDSRPEARNSVPDIATKPDLPVRAVATAAQVIGERIAEAGRPVSTPATIPPVLAQQIKETTAQLHEQPRTERGKKTDVSATTHDPSRNLAPAVVPNSMVATPAVALHKAASARALELQEPKIAAQDAPISNAPAGPEKFNQQVVAGATPQPAPSQMARHAAHQIATVISQTAGNTTEIALNPEELGRVRLSLSAADTSLVLSVLAERPETQDLLRRHIDSLAQEFRALGYESISFSFDADQQSGSAASGDGVNEDAPTEADPPAQAGEGGGMITTSGLDLRL